MVTDHITKDGQPKLVESCSFPLTGVGCVTKLYTSLAVVEIRHSRFVLTEKLKAISLDELQSLTGATLHIENEVVDMQVPEL